MEGAGGGECNTVIVKTVLGMERLAASYMKEIDPGARLEVSPRGFRGIVLAHPSLEKHLFAKTVEEKVPEAEKVIVAEACSEADPGRIAEAAARIAGGFIASDSTFAVRTVRRGSHRFTSIDVNIVVGEHVRRATGASVNLTEPDVVVAVEIIGERAFIGFIPSHKIWRKMGKGKYPLYKLFSRIRIVQMPYLGPLDACRNMGVRVGREVQNFEVAELVIAPIGLVDAAQLKEFLEGVFEGIESRYEVQEKSYARKPWRVRVRLQDLYQFVRSRAGKEPIIVFEPEGKPVSSLAEELYNLVSKARMINLLFGSREGIPEGVYRFADIVVDLAPGIVLSTEYAAAAALTAIATLVHDRLLGEEGQGQH